MKKEDFKTVRGVAMVSNLSMALFVCLVSGVALWIWKPIDITFMSMIAFGVLFLVGGLLNIVAAKKLKEIHFEGTSKQLAESAIKQANFVIFPLAFTLTMNRMRGAMWKWYIDHKMENIESPTKRVLMSQEILEELKEDGFVSQMEYDKRKAQLEEALMGATMLEKRLKDQEAEAKKKPMVAKKAKKGDDEWI